MAWQNGIQRAWIVEIGLGGGQFDSITSTNAVLICLSSLPIGILSLFPSRFLFVQGAVHVETAFSFNKPFAAL